LDGEVFEDLKYFYYISVRYNVQFGDVMISINATNARKNLFKLIDNTAESGEVINIIGKRNNAYLVSEADWRAIEETLYLLSIPGMRESIIEGLNTPIEECNDKPEW
jgi:PHD/YefM family antitoxin component YafN of YafNO toxin-antitoxin module